MVKCRIAVLALAATTIFIAEGVHVPAGAKEKIAPDPEIRVGKLDNGLTWYIRHNENPKGCADFYIAHNVGSLQEEDNQNGLAHFLEHMAFNGTKHYPDKELLDFLTKEGVRFGTNINAYTNRTETVYNLSNIPLVRDSFTDSVLLVLRDWSCDISCLQDALDAERGVISEEWRRKDEPKSRMASKQTGLIYKGAKQAERSVIGTLEVINGFKREEILDFYHKWYRPDLQAIIVVGDFDVDKMEQKIKAVFSDIPAQKNPVPKETYAVPALDAPLFENMTDPTIKYQVLKVIHKTPFPTERDTDEFIRDRFLRQIVSTLVAARFDHAAKKPGSPVKSAILVTNPSSTDFYVSLFTISPKRDSADLENTLRFYEREMRRILEFGFSEEEFEDAKFKVYRKQRLNMESFPSEVTNGQVVKVCTENFLRGLPLAYPSDMKETERGIFGTLTYEDAKPYLKSMFSGSEKIYSWCINENEAGVLPPTGRMEEIIAETAQETLEPEYMEIKDIDLTANPVPGKIVKSKAVKGYPAEKWVLSNGMTVYWTPSEPVRSNDHLAVRIVFDKGYAAFPEGKSGEGRAAAAYMKRNTGFRGTEASVIAGSHSTAGATVSTSIGYSSAEIEMYADRKSAEKGFSMLYLTLTEPYFSGERALGRFVKSNISSLNKPKDADDEFRTEERKIRYGNNPLTEDLDTSDFSALDMNFINEIFSREFSDFGNATAYIASDIDKGEIMALTEKYLASLDTEYAYGKTRPEFLLPAYKGEAKAEKTGPVKSAPKSDVSCCFRTRLKMTPANSVMTEIFDYIMSARYMAQIREARGGTYHVAFGTEIYGTGNIAEATVQFQTRPEMTDVLVSDCIAGMAEAAENGFSDEEIATAKKYLIKRHKDNEKRFRNSLKTRNSETFAYVTTGYDAKFDYDAAVNAVTAENLRKFAASLYKGDRLLSVYNEE